MKIPDSSSVWDKEVFESLIPYIQNKLGVSNVMVRLPDSDFSKESYPCVSLMLMGSRFSTERYEDSLNEVLRTEDEVVLEESAKPYDLTIRFEFWSNKKEDMSNLQAKWLGSHKRYFNLPVKDKSGFVRNCLCLLSSDPREANIISNNDKLLYRMIVSYRISVELNEHVRESKYIAKSIVFSTKEK